MKEDHPRIGEQTEIMNPDDPLQYGELHLGSGRLQWTDPEHDPKRGGYRVVMRIYDDEHGLVYTNIDVVEEETAHRILDAENAGQWGYVE